MALIKCPECGTEVSDRAVKCIKCGFPLASHVKPVKCPECGGEAPGGAVKCGRCGFPFKERGAAKSAPSKQDAAVQLSNERAYSPPAVDDAELDANAVANRTPSRLIIGVIGVVIIGIIVAIGVGTKKKTKLEKGAAVTDAAAAQNVTDKRDGKTYKTVKIGGKTWMAENLNYQAGNSWCYDGENSNCEKYGRLYDWYTAETVCPVGFHLPSRQEWNDLVSIAGGRDAAGKALKSTSGWSGNGTDEYGFSALPGGNRRTNGVFENAGGHGFWWTASENNYDDAYNRRMGANSDYAVEYSNGKSNGYSVRCLMDD